MTTSTISAPDSDLFSFRRYPHSPEQTSVIGRQRAVTLADALEAKGIEQASSLDHRLPRRSYRERQVNGGSEFQHAYTRYPEIVAAVQDLPKGWMDAVDFILLERDRAKIVDADLWTYRVNSYSNDTTTTVIGRQRAEALADAFVRHGINSPYSRTYEHKDEFGDAVYAYTVVPELVELTKGLPRNWTQAVATVLTDRAATKRRADLLASLQAVTHEGIRDFLLTQIDQRGIRTPEVTDLSGLVALSKQEHRANGKPAYNPQPGCKGGLKLKEAICYALTQESYADHSFYAIPVSLTADCDLAICRANLNHFAQCLRTHNGLAGSGCTWTATLVHDAAKPEQAFVLLECRSSISD